MLLIGLKSVGLVRRTLSRLARVVGSVLRGGLIVHGWQKRLNGSRVSLIWRIGKMLPKVLGDKQTRWSTAMGRRQGHGEDVVRTMMKGIW